MGPLVMKSARQKGFTREICQPKFSKVVLPYPSTLTLRGTEWFLKKVKNECRPGWPEETHSVITISVLGWVCPKQRLRQRHLGRQFALEVIPGAGMEGRWSGAENDRKSRKRCIFVKSTTTMGDPPHKAFWVWGGSYSHCSKLAPQTYPPHTPFSGYACLSTKGIPTAVPSHHIGEAQGKRRRNAGWAEAKFCAKLINTPLEMVSAAVAECQR